MATLRRPWFLRAGVAIASAVGALVLLAPAATYADSTVNVTSVDVTTIAPGQTATVGFTVVASGSISVTLTATGDLNNNVTIKYQGSSCPAFGSCFTDSLSGSKSYQFTATANQGVTSQLSGRIDVKVSGSASGDDQTPTITIQPAQGPTFVVQISGTVKDSNTGSGVSGATVEMQDSANHSFTTTTNLGGVFTFKSTGTSQIAPGTEAVGALKDGYTQATKSADAQAGQSVTVDLVLVPATSASPIVPTDTGGPTSSTSGSPAANGNVGSAGGGGGGLPLIFVIIGALLVIGPGVGLLLWYLRRRGDDLDDDVEPGPGPGPRPLPPGGGRRGMPRPPGGPPRGRPPGPPGPPMGKRPDNPAMMRRPPADEYPDPYGAPLPRPGQPGFRGGLSGGYGGPGPGGGPRPPRPGSPAPYGAGPGGRLDAPTGYMPHSRQGRNGYPGPGRRDRLDDGPYDEGAGYGSDGGRRHFSDPPEEGRGGYRPDSRSSHSDRHRDDDYRSRDYPSGRDSSTRGSGPRHGESDNSPEPRRALDWLDD